MDGINNNTQKVSVITVCYNAIEGIERTILSVINQTYSNIEYVIIDGGSTDGTLDIIKKYEEYISCWISEPDKGIYDAMNKGIERSTGEWLNFMNAGDSFVDNNVIEKVAPAFQEDAKLIYGNYYLSYPKVNLLRISQNKQLDVVDFVLNGIHHQASFFHKYLFEKYGMYDTSYRLASDWKFYVDCVGFGNEKTTHVDIVINYFEVGGASTCAGSRYSEEVHQIMKDYFGVYYKYITELAEYRQSSILTELLAVRLFIKRIGLGKKMKYAKWLIQSKLWGVGHNCCEAASAFAELLYKEYGELFNRDTISVITVCYNAEREIERTIQSVISQTYDNVEYIIVDGGSTDNTMNIIKKYADKIDQIVSEPDRGIYDAMNKGIRLAHGEWINMMNAGDVFADKDVLTNVFAQDIPYEKTFLYSDSYSLRPNGKRIVRPMSFEKGALNHQNTIYRRSLHDEHGMYIVTKKLIISDYLFFIRIPEEQVMKVDTIISEFEGGGVSAQGCWARQQALCADVVFRRRTFWGMIRHYMWKKTKAILPVETKDKIKIKLGLTGNI